MTEKEKAKAYDEAIERAKKLYGDGITEGIFPELKESEDEKIRRWIIDDIRYNMNNEALNNSEYKKKAEKAIDWLERQGKNSIDKTKPSFNVGDWVVLITTKNVYQVEKKENYEYTLRHISGDSLCLPFYNDVLIREWTIEDAKNGDVLVDEDNNIGIFQECEGMYWYSYTYLGYDGQLRGFSMGGSHEQTDTHPATKEQRDLLIQKINDAGYEWDVLTRKN